MDQVREGDYLLDLVALEVPDEVPLDVIGQLRLLVDEFLDVVLAEVPLAEVVKFLDSRHGLGLGDGHEGCIGGLAGGLDGLVGREVDVGHEGVGFVATRRIR